jgi:hypothetical protein
MVVEAKCDQRMRRSKQDDGSIRSPSLSPARAEHSADQRRLAFRPMPFARSQRGTASLTLYGGGAIPAIRYTVQPPANGMIWP